ncbi:MAG: hypothetical protein OER56_06845, partial [Hyphomicrobiales bacterium]|nr:hypothetical protein [Hyphomicrobiales bacterium]
MFIFEQPQTDFSGSFAGGQASGGQIIDATIRSMWQVENTNAASVAIQDAMSQRIDAIKEATGVQLQHPLDRLHTALGNGDIPEGSGERDSLGAVPDVDKIAQFFFDDFTKQLADLAKNHPDKAEIIGADRSLVSDARKLSIEADEQFGKMFGSRDDIIVPYGALLFGGAVGAMRAPIEAFTLLLGAGPGAGRLVAQRVLHTAAREFAINAGAEAALQPAVQSYRKSLGLEAGFDLAVRNVAFAGILGAAFGGTVQGGAEIVSAAARRKVADRQFAAAAEALASDSPLRDLETMSGEATAKLLEPIRYDLSPEARGAIDMTEVLVALDEYRVPGVPDEQFDVSAAQGIRFAEDPEVHSLPASLVDDIRDDFDVPRPKKPAGRRPDNLTRFIARQGGLRRDLITDDAGDLLGGGVKGSRGAIKAGDLDKVFVPGVGALVRKEGGLTINQARELAAEAGFLRGFGTAEEAIENSSDADFLADLLQDVEGKENRVFAEADHATAEEFRQFDEQISGNQRDLDDALNNLDDALSDDVSLDLKRRAVELQLEERIDAGDALERAILEEQ